MWTAPDDMKPGMPRYRRRRAIALAAILTRNFQARILNLEHLGIQLACSVALARVATLGVVLEPYALALVLWFAWTAA